MRGMAMRTADRMTERAYGVFRTLFYAGPFAAVIMPSAGLPEKKRRK